MSVRSDHALRLTEVETAFGSLPDRYPGADPGSDASYHVRLGDLGHTWEVREALAFEGPFRLPAGRPPLLQIHDVPVGRYRISTLTMGHGRRAAAARSRRDAGVAIRDRGSSGWLAERLAGPAVGTHLRNTVAQLRRVVEHEHSREQAAQRRAARAG
jgi:hypothetical protein